MHTTRSRRVRIVPCVCRISIPEWIAKTTLPPPPSAVSVDCQASRGGGSVAYETGRTTAEFLRGRGTSSSASRARLSRKIDTRPRRDAIVRPPLASLKEAERRARMEMERSVPAKTREKLPHTRVPACGSRVRSVASPIRGTIQRLSRKRSTTRRSERGRAYGLPPCVFPERRIPSASRDPDPGSHPARDQSRRYPRGTAVRATLDGEPEPGERGFPSRPFGLIEERVF